MKLKFFTGLIFLLFLQSCVPYKDIVYMQGNITNQTLSSTSYKIQKGDILYINLKSADESINRLFAVQEGANSANLMTAEALFFKGYTVDSNGFVDLPIIHKIKLEGKTFKEAESLIKQKFLATQFTGSADLYIKVKLAGIPYTVVGEVGAPQTGVLYKENPTIFDVLANAKDITAVGNRRSVVLLRKELNRPHKHILDLTKADIVYSPYFHIRPNDIIYVKPLKQKVWGTGTTLQQTISTTITALSLITTIILLSKYAN